MAYISEKTGRELDELLDKVKQGGEGASIIIDTELSEESNNAIANSAVTNALKKKVDTTLFKEDLNDLQLSIDTLYDETVRRWEFDEAIENKADKDGYYPAMTVGKAENLVGRGESTEEEFSFRPSAGSLSIEDGSAKITSIKGNSVVWNQQLPLGLVQVDLDNTEGSAVLVKNFAGASREMSIKANHIYYACANANVDNRNIVAMIANINKSPINIMDGAIITAPFDRSGYFLIRVPAGQSVNGTMHPQVIDLTQMFGAEVAEVIATSSDPIAEYHLRKPMNIADEFAYNAGTLVDMRVNEIKSVGDNAYNPELGYARVLGGKEYNIHYSVEGLYEMYFSRTLEGNKEPIDAISNPMTFPADGYVWIMGMNGEPLYSDNVCICLQHSYPKPVIPYVQDVKDLSFISELFPNGMRSAGNVCDEIRYDKATQKWQKIERVGVRAYEEGDAENSEVTTDGVNTNYALANPNPEDLNIDLTPYYEIWDFGTEEAIASGISTPFRADIVYQFNAVDRIRNNSTKIEELEAKIQSLTLAISALQTNE